MFTLLRSLCSWRYCLRAKVKFWRRPARSIVSRDNERSKRPPPHSVRGFVAFVAILPLKLPANNPASYAGYISCRIRRSTAVSLETNTLICLNSTRLNFLWATQTQYLSLLYIFSYPCRNGSTTADPHAIIKLAFT